MKRNKCGEFISELMCWLNLYEVSSITIVKCIAIVAVAVALHSDICKLQRMLQTFVQQYHQVLNELSLRCGGRVQTGFFYSDLMHR